MRARTLEKAISALSPTTEGKGLCFHWSAALVLDIPDSELCIGLLHDDLIHAWVEYKGLVFAPTLIRIHGGLYQIPKDLYYHDNRVRDVKRVSREQIIQLGVYRHLTTGEPMPDGKALGSELLQLVGLKWRETPEGTVRAIIGG